ncbi:protein AF-9-like isoform X3 [Mytilus galloprovincialis]|uniref:protein AF-9-like isoform X3 n=1 Tax=Mytilus galloprovincialis TaxID=29158 RepID=UPI003F7C07DD
MNHKETCDHEHDEPRECPNRNDGCQEILSFKDMTDHITNHCLYSLVPCPDCQSPVMRKDLQNHQDDCTRYPITCKFHCDVGELPREESVQVKIELGHRASQRDPPSQGGFTHDWTVYVRGPEGCNISNFVEKVVFNLHHSFPDHKRAVVAPPYQVAESGYAGFTLPIDIYFKNKEETKKIRFQYDLYLKFDDSPVNHIRCEKLTFQNPTDEFKKKLLKSGGTVVSKQALEDFNQKMPGQMQSTSILEVADSEL